MKGFLFRSNAAVYIVHSIVDVVRVLHQSASKLPKAEIRIQNQIELLAFILSVKLFLSLSLSLIKVFPISIFLHPTVYVFTLWSQIRGVVVGVVPSTKYSQLGPHSWQGCSADW